MFDLVGFLNTREEAVAIWLFVVAIWLLQKPEIRSTVVEVLRSFAHPKVSGTVIVGLVYAATVVWALWLAGFWEGWMLKSTIYWFVGTALVLKVSSVGQDEGYFWHIARNVLAVAVVVQFVVGLDAFPLPVEIVLVPILALVGGSLALAQSDSRYAPMRRTLEALTVSFAITVLAFSLSQVAKDLNDFISFDTGRAFLLAPVLTITFLPYLYVFALIAAYELVFMRLDRALRNNGLADGGEHWAVRWAVIRACGVRLSSIHRFSPAVMPRLCSAESTEDVREAVRAFAQSRHRLAG